MFSIKLSIHLVFDILAQRARETILFYPTLYINKLFSSYWTSWTRYCTFVTWNLFEELWLCFTKQRLNSILRLEIYLQSTKCQFYSKVFQPCSTTPEFNAKLLTFSDLTMTFCVNKVAFWVVCCILSLYNLCEHP